MLKRATLFALALLCGLATQGRASVQLNFIIDGDTFTQPFSISNASTSGELVTRFQLDLAGTGFVFDTVDLGPPGNSTAGTAFAPTGGTDITTGLTSPASVADGSTLLDMNFNNFDPGETFSWLIDIDHGTNLGLVSVLGNNLIGASATVDFSNGLRLIGVLAPVPGNDDASAFTVTDTVPTPGTAPEAASVLMWGLFTMIGTVATRSRWIAVSRS